MDLTIVYAVAIAVLIGFSAFFSMSETAFTSANTVRLKKMAKDGDKKAETTIRILENYDKFITTILVGNNLVNIASTSIATMTFSILLGASKGALASTVFMTLVILIFGEITPKSLAKKNPEKICIKICRIIYALELILTPISWFFTKLTAAIGKKDDSTFMTEDELEVIIEEIEEEGVLEKRESDLIKSAIRFDDIQVSEVYVPRMDIVAVEASESGKALGEKFADSEFSRIPVYEGTIDNIIGVVYAKEFYANVFRDKDPPIKSLVRPVKYFPETTSIATILADFQKSKIHMAVILDSFGGTMGIVTMEDLLEELVGDIWDESDEVQQDMSSLDECRYAVKGTANIYDIMERIGLNFEPEEYEDYSVTGYIFYKLDRAPLRGDVIELDNAEIMVVAVKGRRVTECIFKKKEPEPVPEK